MGRPRELDEDTVVAAASTRALLAHSGLTPASLYSAFGNKRSFLLRAPRIYLYRNLREGVIRLEKSLTWTCAAAAFFPELIDLCLAASDASRLYIPSIRSVSGNCSREFAPCLTLK
jgi:TetR/AcrR family transcriptional repressor of nem operon